MTIKSNYIYLTVILLLVFLIGYLTQCNRQVTVIKPDSIHDSNVVLNHEIKKSTANTDSRETRLEAGKDTIVKVEIRYKTKVIEIIKLAPDTCNPYLIAMINEAADLDSIKNAQLSRQDSSIMDYKSQIKLYKSVTHNDTLQINQLTTDLNTEKESNTKYWKGFWTGAKWGTVFGIAVDESARAGIRMIKP